MTKLIVNIKVGGLSYPDLPLCCIMRTVNRHPQCCVCVCVCVA